MPREPAVIAELLRFDLRSRSVRIQEVEGMHGHTDLKVVNDRGDRPSQHITIPGAFVAAVVEALQDFQRRRVEADRARWEAQRAPRHASGGRRTRDRDEDDE